MDHKDLESAAAKRIGIQCFNETWDLLDRKKRTRDETIEMLAKAHTSLYMWKQVEDHTPTNLSIGYWQVSRAYAEAGEPGLALLFGEKCVEVSKAPDVDSFYLAYGHEAVARAMGLGGRIAECRAEAALAREALGRSKETEIDQLEKDLADLEGA